MSKSIKPGDRIRVTYETVYTGTYAVRPTALANRLAMAGGTYVANVTAESIAPDFEIGDIVRHRATGAVRVFEPTGFRVLRSKHMDPGEFVEYEPGWDLHNFTADKWEKVAYIG